MLARFLNQWVVGCLAALTFFSGAASAESVRVELVQAESGWELHRDGEPYTVRGAGGDQYLELLAASGGNSIRTWGVGDDTRALLDEAHANGLTVTLGIWIGHERHGFSYNDFDQVAAQFDAVRDAVLAYKDHPALLMWGIGNEMEGYEEGSNPAIWSHIEACAALVKRLDPHHPTMSVIAEIGGRKVEAIHRLCPSIDIVGINSYGGAMSIPRRYAAAGATKPYIVTEFGPPGAWEVGLNSFGAPNELTSTAKAGMYRDVYNTLHADTGRCLGSYAFLWGAKVEATTTWFGMFLADGSRLGAVDAMTLAWSGESPDNLCPVIESFELDGAYEKAPGARISVELAAADPEGEPLEVQWLLMRDSTTYMTGGDFVEAPPTYPGSIVSSGGDGCTLTLPDDEYGVFRVYVVVKDPAGNAAIANLPLFAGSDPNAPTAGNPAPVTPGQAVELPLAVYSEGGADRPWIPSGYMGNANAIAMDEGHTDNVHSGESCLRVGYNAAGEWGGVVWQSPVNDWGDVAGGYDLSGAVVLEFWARGANGGEVVNFGFGLIGADKPFPDSASGKMDNVELTAEWQRYTIELPADADLRRIKTGFFWSLAGQGEPVTFYLDDIAFRTEVSDD